MLNEREMAAEICNAESNGEAISLYLFYRPFLPHSRFVLASNNGTVPGFTVNRQFEHGAVVRGLFKADKIFVLDETVLFDNLSGLPTTYAYDQSIALDTMALSYIEPYLDKRMSKVPKDFVEVFEFIARDDVNVDPLPYMHENLFNLTTTNSCSKIQNKLRGYEVLRTLDRTHLEEAGEVRSVLTDPELDGRAKKMLSDMIKKSKNKVITANFIYRHRILFSLLLKMVEIQLRSSNERTIGDKVTEFFEFQNDRFATIYARESIIAQAYFEKGTDLTFFGKMQRKKDDIFKTMHGMAWDLLHIRHMEKALTLLPEKAAQYFFPAFLTFDKRLIDIIDLYPLKACAIYGEDQEPIPFFEGDFIKQITQGMTNPEEFTSRFFSRNAIAKRETRRSRDHRLPRTIKKELGKIVAEIVQVPFPVHA